MLEDKVRVEVKYGGVRTELWIVDGPALMNEWHQKGLGAYQLGTGQGDARFESRSVVLDDAGKIFLTFNDMPAPGRCMRSLSGTGGMYGSGYTTIYWKVLEVVS